MEPTVCPWCQSEIVWDEELGPEEHCPHCANELKGYRTLNIDLNDDEEYTEHSDEEAYEASEEEEQELHSMWGSDTESLAALRTVDKYGESHDLYAFEQTVEAILDEQDEVPECLHCREYMLHAGSQSVTEQGFHPVAPSLLKTPVLKPPFEVNIYVCPGCFQVQYNLAENDRLALIKNLIRPQE
ncbi:hypothetical protein JCM10914A_07960 [Paenibacillus sp. JCM 10914]|uniref:hypothetical protein n=1 Tax=Paenibacillus sp. JCM 10914 TaxID=1236974 RepID=UPI0003CC9BA3|nr:hypothetical protein [Paenibacillus sp. JCM 10914]GAE05693.1 hypothetical protein JCM10914_1810 [Paenibacillus sp. JCM 10914]